MAIPYFSQDREISYNFDLRAIDIVNKNDYYN